MSGNPYAAILWARRQRQIPNKVAKNVLTVLATYANPQGTGAWPSQEELAADTGFSPRAVRMALAWLEAEGYLRRVERRRRNGSRRSDEYVLALDRPADNRHGVPVVSAPATGTPGRPKRNPTTDQPARDSGPTTFDQPHYQPEDHTSEPTGSGPGTPAPSAKARLFSDGRSILTALGLKPREAGDLIGRWLKASGDDAERVLATIRRAQAAAPHGPVPWITAALKPLHPNGAAHALRLDGASGTAAPRRSGRSSLSVALAGVARVAASRGIQLGKPADAVRCAGPTEWPGGYPTALAEAHRHDAYRYRPADRSA